MIEPAATDGGAGVRQSDSGGPPRLTARTLSRVRQSCCLFMNRHFKNKHVCILHQHPPTGEEASARLMVAGPTSSGWGAASGPGLAKLQGCSRSPCAAAPAAAATAACCGCTRCRPRACRRRGLLCSNSACSVCLCRPR